MALPAKWPWSLTLKPNCGTPGSSQWDSSKPGRVRLRGAGEGEEDREEYVLKSDIT